MHVAPKAVQNSQSSCKSAQFSAKHRLLQEDGFDRVFHNQSVSGKYFKIFFARNNGKNARLGIIVSKKIFPRAVDRNRAKRSVREAFRQHGIKNSKLDIVVMVKPFFLLPPAIQRGILEELFSKVENRCTES